MLSNWRTMVQRARRPFLYKGRALEPNHQYPIWSLILAPSYLSSVEPIFSHFANMNNQANTVITTHTDMEHQWAEQCCPDFVPAYPAHQGGLACFDSGVGMVSHAVITCYPHPANSMVGAYPSMNEVSYHRLPQLSGS